MPKRKTPDKPSCVICMSAIKNKANIDGCTHEFCRKCIVKWAETENSCPMCRMKFNKVTTEKSTKKIKNKIQRPDHYEQGEVRDMVLDLLVRYITDDDFKLYLASIFLCSRPSIEAIVMANCIRQSLCSPRFSAWIDRTASLDQREEYYCARTCIETMFEGRDSTSITI